jgi:hypothetical protein
MIHSPFYLLVSSALVGLAAAWVTAVLQYPLVRWACRVDRMRLSSGFWFAWGMLPIVMGSFFVMFTLSFDWLRAVGWLPNPHIQYLGHQELGLSHTSQDPHGGGLFWGAALACSVWIAAAAIRSYRRYVPTNQLLSGVCSAKKAIGQPLSFAVVPSRFPLAFTAGLFFPRFYLTQAAVELLTAEEQDIVESHEREHIRKRDPLRLLLFTFCQYWMPGVRYIRRQWERMVEIECDRASVKAGFAPNQIASTILKFEKAKTIRSSPTMTLAYPAESASNLRVRIKSLFYEPPYMIGQVPILCGWAALWIFLLFRFHEINHELRVFLGSVQW